MATDTEERTEERREPGYSPIGLRIMNDPRLVDTGIRAEVERTADAAADAFGVQAEAQRAAEPANRSGADVVRDRGPYAAPATTAPEAFADAPGELLGEPARPEGAARVAAPGPRPGGSQFGRVADQLVGPSFAEWLASMQDEDRLRQEKVRALGPMLTDLAGRFQQTLAQRPEVPRPPDIPPPPPRELRGFLSPVAGEQPEQTVMKLIQAVGLMGTAIGGLVMGDARAGLAAFTGAMQGWAEGDEARAERDFKNWQDAAKHANDTWQRQRQHYTDVVEAQQLDLTSRLKLLELVALQYDNPALAAAARSRDLAAVVKVLTEQADVAAKFELAASNAAVAHEDRVMRNQISLMQAQSQDLHRQALERLAAERNAIARQKLEQSGAFAATLAPGGIDLLANEFNKTGKLPPLGAGMAGVRALIFARAAEMLAEEGLSPNQNIANRQVIRANQTALNANMKMAAQMGSFIRTSQQAMDMARDLNHQVERSGFPIMNVWTQEGQRLFSSNPVLAQFDIATKTVAAEYARVMNSATGGGVSTVTAMNHAFSLLRTAQTPEAYDAALEQMHREMEARVESFYKTTRDLMQQTTSGVPAPIGGTTGTATPGGAAPSLKTLPPPPPGEVWVRSKKNPSQIGTMGPKHPDFNQYERIQ